MLCSYCAIRCVGLWPRVRPIGIDGAQHLEGWPLERRRFLRYLIDPHSFRLLGSPESWGLPITVTLHKRDLEAYCSQIAEGGLRTVLPEEVPVGSAVALQFVLPPNSPELHVQAVIRYQVGLQHGMELTSLNEEEQALIRQFCHALLSVGV